MPRLLQSVTEIAPSDNNHKKGVYYEPTKADHDRVKKLVLLGATDETIASCIGKDGISMESLRRKFRYELTRYRQLMLSEIAAGAYAMALGTRKVEPELQARMMMFILKTKAGWSESESTVINATNVQIVKRVIGVDDKDV